MILGGLREKGYATLRNKNLATRKEEKLCIMRRKKNDGGFLMQVKTVLTQLLLGNAPLLIFHHSTEGEIRKKRDSLQPIKNKN